MPGKKKKGGKAKGKGRKGKKAEPELTPEQLEHKALVEEAEALKRQLQQEAEDINVFQQQRTQLNYFWIVEKKKLEDKRAELRNKDRERQDLEEKHQVEIKVYKQRVKHLLYEHQDELTHLKTANETTEKMLQDDHRDAEGELKSDRRALKVQLKEMELAHEAVKRGHKMDHDRSISELRAEFERRAREMNVRYDDLIKRLHKSLEDSRKAEIARIERRKDQHITDLMRAHEKAFSEIKNYYNDITHNNLDLIKSLKEDVEKMKREEKADEKRMVEIALENKRMSEPLEQATEDVGRLEKRLEEHLKDKEELKRTKAELMLLEDERRRLSWELEVMQQRFERLDEERHELHERFQDSVYTAQQRAGFKNLLLEKRLAAVQDALERKEAQLNEVLAQANLGSAVMGDISSKLEDVIEAKNQQIRDLQGELDRLVQLHRDTVEQYQTKLEEYGVPLDEVGFRTLHHVPAMA